VDNEKEKDLVQPRATGKFLTVTQRRGRRAATTKNNSYKSIISVDSDGEDPAVQEEDSEDDFQNNQVLNPHSIIKIYLHQDSEEEHEIVEDPVSSGSDFDSEEDSEEEKKKKKKETVTKKKVWRGIIYRWFFHLVGNRVKRKEEERNQISSSIFLLSLDDFFNEIVEI
jgi:hypothetical protein